MILRFILRAVVGVPGFCLLVGCSGQSGSPSGPSSGPSTARPANGLVCDEPQWDLGEVLVKGKSVDFDHTFVLRNNSANSVRIRDVRSDCGCLVAQGYSPNVEPGGQTEIKVKISVFGAPGPFRKTITVIEESPANRELPLAVLGRRAISDLLYSTPRNVNFGTVMRGESAVRRFTLSRYDGSAVNFRDMISEDSGMDLDGEPVSTMRHDAALGKDCECVEVPVRFTAASHSTGLLKSKITFRTTSADPGTAKLDVPVEVQITGALSPWVESVFAKRLERGATIERPLVNPDGPPDHPVIRGASYEGDDSITVELAQAGGEDSAVAPRVRISRPQNSTATGVARGTLHLQTTGPQGELVTKIDIEAFLPR